MYNKIVLKIWRNIKAINYFINGHNYAAGIIISVLLNILQCGIVVIK